MLATRFLLVGFLLLIPEGLFATDAEPALEELTATAKKSVVVITFQGRGGDREGLGSGVIIDANGLIATNLHVIGEARPISVQLADGRKFAVQAVHASDRALDLAIIQIDAKDLPSLALGDSAAVKDGQAVVAIGNPLGLERSVVTGVLSGTREIEGRNMLQVAIPIEKGNSGGPLLDRSGNVLGLLTLKSMKTQNLGFAVPVNDLKTLIKQPNPVPMSRWLTIGKLDPHEWTVLPGGRWQQRAGRLLVDGRGQGIGGRALCLSEKTPPAVPYEVAVSVRFDQPDGAAGLVFCADGGDKHYGFYPSSGELRLTRFDGPDVYSWHVLQQMRPAEFDSSKWNTIKVRIEADTLKCYWNETLVIESQDKVYRTGKVGLCKFRHTEAEFKEFRLAEKVPSLKPSAAALELVQKLVTNLSPTDAPADELVERLTKEPHAHLGAFEHQARLLEQQAERVRQLAGLVHTRQILAEFRKLVSLPDQEIDLIHAALEIAHLNNPELDVAAYRQEVARLAALVAAKLTKAATDAEKLAALNSLLFNDLGFHGSRNDYHSRSNSYLNEVLDDREGLPITLSVLYLDLAQRLGVNVVGIGLPGHFVVQHLPKTGDSQLIDVFHQAKPLSAEEARALVKELSKVPWNDEFLTPMSRKAILARMLQNLLGNARDLQEPERMLRYVEALLVLDENAASHRFFRAVICYNLQRYDKAKADVNWLLDQQPEGVDLRAVRELELAILRQQNQQQRIER